MEKNFDTLEVGGWYITSNNTVVNIVRYNGGDDYPFESSCYDEYTKDGISFEGGVEDLIAKIAPPDLTPLPAPKRKIKKWQWLYKTDENRPWLLTKRYLATKEDANTYLGSGVAVRLIPLEINVIEVEK